MSLSFSCPVMTMQKPRSLPASPLLIRPRGAPLVFPYQNYIVRSWRLDDRSGAAEVIRKSLEQYGLGWEPEGADADAILVDEHYIGNAEFWVVCDEQDEAKIYGTAAFRSWERSPEDTAELRKLYLSSDVRNVGLGSFLCDACEERARQLGFKYAVIETASQLSEAVRLYVHKNYSRIAELDTERCDIAMRKTLLASSEDRIGPERVKVVDRRGYFVATAPRDKARRYRMLYGAIVVLILSQDGERILIQRRSMQKADFPGVLDPFVAGGVSDPTLMATATRELEEELGLNANNFDWTPFWTDVYVHDRGVGDRCCFWGFVARATGPESEIEPRFVDGEVDECFWLNRREVDSCQMPSPVWAFASTLPAPGGLEDCAFFTASS